MQGTNFLRSFDSQKYCDKTPKTNSIWVILQTWKAPLAWPSAIPLCVPQLATKYLSWKERLWKYDEARHLFLRISPSVFYWCQISWVWKKDLMNFSNFSPTSSGDVLKGWIKSIIIIIVIIKIKIIKRNYNYNHHHQNPTSNLYMLKGWTISNAGKPSIAEIFPLPKSPENGHFAKTKKFRNISPARKYSQQKWSMICVN